MLGLGFFPSCASFHVAIVRSAEHQRLKEQRLSFSELMIDSEDDDAAKAGMSPSEENQKARWAKPYSSSAVDPLHALKGKLWALCKKAGATTIPEAEKKLRAHKIITAQQTLATLSEEQLKDAISKLTIVIEESKQ